MVLGEIFELLNGEIFYTLKEVQILIERWRDHYNTVRPHSALGYRPPAPEFFDGRAIYSNVLPRLNLCGQILRFVSVIPTCIAAWDDDFLAEIIRT
jgi:hypothetical protein